ncbi:hypothetical protein [Allokutzneria sp. NRRL B-24872]|uniref:hypothetical protein n=1 Tax=Allokutzneria sp. NRRL B-24872 TaxID=1137961 RepID=UPI000A3A425A|nr:hypothetical protein [Allokutzneria sp. NRRL B-24872]
MTRSLTVLAAAGAAAALSLLAPLTAQAATGQFVVLTATGQSYAIQNPPAFKCFSLAWEGVGANNRTNATALVYSNAQCSGFATTVPPGSSTLVPNGYQSVKFSS